MNVMQATSDDPGRSKRHSMRTAASRLATWCASALVIAGCTASSDEVHPPGNELFFPSGMAVSPDQKALFVAEANSELRFDSGAISVIDIGRVAASVADWKAARGFGGATDCEVDPDHSETVICDEAYFMNVGAGVRIGNFATDVAVQRFPQGAVRVFSPTRGDPSIAWADYKDGALSCGPTEEFGLCDDAHRLAQIENDPDADPIPDEPFSIFADGDNGFVMVSHLNIGGVSLISSPNPDGDPKTGKRVTGAVRVVDVRAGFFLPPAVNAFAGTSGIAGRRPAPGAAGPSDIVYVASQTDQRIQTFTVGSFPVDTENDERPPEASYLIPGNFFQLNNVGNLSGQTRDTRGIQFSADGNRLYTAVRSPPSMQVFDTSIGPGGYPRNVGAGGMDICRQASTLAVVGSGEDERVYVTCFQDGTVYVIDPRSLDTPEDILLVGHGPYSIAAATDAKLLFVSNFLDDTIAVVDLEPGSVTYNRVVLRIGKTKVTP
jgi:DNA-binding beta-propeller fold protein YncE